MGDTEDIDAIKQRKKERLVEADGSDGDRPETTNEPIHVETGEQFDEIVADHDAVLVDFYADWCGPCKMLEPTVKELAAETNATVLKVDVDAHQELAGRHQVRGVPTVVLFADGEVAEQVVGVREKDHYASLIERHAA